MMNIPNEILNYIKTFIPFNIMKFLQRESNELKVAKQLSPTPSSHCIDLMISRFLWRWVFDISYDQLNNLNCLDIPDYKFNLISRETCFINDSLKFHKLWTGPNIKFKNWISEKNKRETGGIYIGSM